jgi:hypothetical protein
MHPGPRQNSTREDVNGSRRADITKTPLIDIRLKSAKQAGDQDPRPAKKALALDSQ